MAADPPGGGERILVVEDDATYRSYLKERLAREGHEVTAVADVEQALSRLEELVPTILITDLLLAGRDGLDLCREVRSRPRWQHLPILVLSGAEDSAAVGEVVGLGLIWYLRKGASWSHLEKTLGNLISRAQEARRPRAQGPAAEPEGVGLD